jgi:UDP-glucose 4-epimerase
MRVLVTGAAGFLGSRLVERLLREGTDVVAVGRGAAPDTVARRAGLRWIVRDLAQASLDADDLRDVGVVVHLAGATLGAGRDEWRFLTANEATTVRLLQACRHLGPRVIYASSQVVYGDVNHLSVTEEFPLDVTGSAYACSKVNGEAWIRRFQRETSSVSLALRLTGFVEGGGAIDYMIDRALRDEPIELFSEGRVRRDYLPVDRGIDAMVAAIRCELAPGFTAINVGSGQSIASRELAELIAAALDSSSEIVLTSKPAPQGDFVFDIRRAERTLSFQPGDLRASVREYALQRGAMFRGGTNRA